MKKKYYLTIFLPGLFIFVMYMVFYDKIETKPSDAGFWMILAMGISIGVLLSSLFKTKNKF